jgi:hypothetical protein
MSAKTTPAGAVCAVQDTRLAASLAALGFPFKAEMVQPSQGKLAVQFIFSGRSTRPGFEAMALSCAALHQAGKLEAQDAMHPLCVMMRAQRNYDALLAMQHGRPHRLGSTAGDQMTLYTPGQEKFLEAAVETKDLPLAAALAGVGLPVVRIEGGDGGRRYWLPRHGYARRRADGSVLLEDAQVLIERAPCEADPYRLKLEITDPAHPVCYAYDALCTRVLLKAELRKRTPLLQLQQGAATQALISMNASGRVMDRVTRHMKAPPVRW